MKYRKKHGDSFSPEYNAEDLEEFYEFSLEREERPMFEERPPSTEERPVREVIIRKEGRPQLEEQPIRPLKLMGGEVLGSIFDRVEFLRKRIEEIKDAMKTREAMHREMVDEINTDIREKEEFANKASDVMEKRNFKLDISVLRKEKRHENVQYWHDITELRSELRELLEKYETESKIVSIFRQPGEAEKHD
jgi:uncharacterized protein YqeY